MRKIKKNQRNSQGFSADAEKPLTSALKEALLKEELALESQVMSAIRKRQKAIPQLTISNFGYLVRLGKAISPGCQSCNEGKWEVLHCNTQCNCSCRFCPEIGTLHLRKEKLPQGYYNIHAGIYDEQALKLQIHLFRHLRKDFAWIGGEIFLILKDILPLIRYMHKAYPGAHQWIYTNGMLADKKNMQELYAAGIKEIRFNLAATNFNRNIIKKMAVAKRIFPHVCMEVPMLTDVYKGLIANRNEILDTGVNYFNLAEFMVGANCIKAQDITSEGKLYKYKRFITSPVISRQLAYDVIEQAVREKWPVAINDCSNDTKYLKLSVQQKAVPLVPTSLVEYWHSNLNFSDIKKYNKLVSTKIGRLKLKADIFVNTATKNKNPAGS